MKELDDYIHSMRAAGYSTEQIREALMAAGHNAENIESSVGEFQGSIASYIYQMAAQGFTKSYIQAELIRAGHSLDDVKEIFNGI
jgi:SOS response regulatory protein OraA/RecX